ncbi:MAG: hypothetical protein VZR95_03570 [Alphaproteobacteria bacterium]
MKELLKSKRESLKVSLIACTGLVAFFLLGLGTTESLLMAVMAMCFGMLTNFSFYKGRLDLRRWSLLPLSLGVVIAILCGICATAIFILMAVTTVFAVSAKKLDAECAI